MATSQLQYHDVANLERLAALGEQSRGQYACAAAELLFPTYAAFFPDEAGRARSALDLAWADSSSSLASSELQEELLGLYIDEDEGEIFSTAVAQNAIGALVFALRTAQSGNSKDALDAGMQVYELTYFAAGGEYAERDSSKVVQRGLAALELLFETLESQREHELRALAADLADRLATELLNAKSRELFRR